MVIVLGFSLLYLWFILFPGKVAPEALHYFSAEQISQGRDHSRSQQLLFLIGVLTEILLIVWFIWSGKAAGFSGWLQRANGGNYYRSSLLFFLALWVVLRLIHLPLSYFGSFYLQRKWGFSTQTLGSWWLDYLKGAGLDLIFSAFGVLLFFWILKHWPRTWWLVGASLFSIWLVVQNFIWPVVVSPLFNRFEPAKDPAILSMVNELASKADIPVDEVLVMDASRRTTRANAYFAGLAGTKQIVLYDTLLKNYPPDQVKAVIAHEMAHWRQGHIIKGLTLGIIGNFLLWGLLFIFIRSVLPPSRYHPPYTWALTILFFLTVSFATSPLQNTISRSMEKEADQVSIQLTGDVAAAIGLQINLVSKNSSDVSPPAFIEWFSYSHPAVLNRIHLLQQTNINP
ncbi:Ste24 endopeptidase [Desulforamulus reducens MI-1]|uniref:Ste24 endopeptidase n=1 Tax=Desulforamulus reducens (strain ATCC BAA-1160 / DSM 100696 / MI-1) TaxID=349161 RepID=A4J9G6_DESRM|nr:M48 family metallopeptidase [Desulforamulus reducens]ABO51719.1 Ste24 endopeptidase [Desulforamulus reducens MI-1]